MLILKQVCWLVEMFAELAYFSLVREPLEKLDESHKNLDPWEYVLYIMGLSFLIEGAIFSISSTKLSIDSKYS